MAQKGENKRSAKEVIRSISTLAVDTQQVADVDSKTTVGCLSRRNKSTTPLATIIEEMRNDVLDATIKQGDEVGKTRREEEPTCLLLPESEWLFKRDIVVESKQLDNENSMIQPHGPGNGTPPGLDAGHSQDVWQGIWQVCLQHWK